MGKDHKWLIGEQKADYIRVSSYLNNISFMEGEEFAYNFKHGSEPDYFVIFDGNNMLNFNLKCCPESGNEKYFRNPGLNADISFSGKALGIFGQIVRSKKHFLGKKQRFILFKSPE